MAKYFDKTLSSPIDLSDQQKFKELFDGYFAPLCVFARQYVGNFHDEDVVSTVFFNLFQKKLKFNTHEEFVYFIYKSVKNKCLDTLKSNNRMVDRNQAYFQELEHENLFNQIVENEIMAETYREIQLLPTYSRRIIEMSYLEGMSNQEFADELQLSLQTIKNYKRNAVINLKSVLLRKIMFFLFF